MTMTSIKVYHYNLLFGFDHLILHNLDGKESYRRGYGNQNFLYEYVALKCKKILHFEL